MGREIAEILSGSAYRGRGAQRVGSAELVYTVAHGSRVATLTRGGPTGHRGGSWKSDALSLLANGASTSSIVIESRAIGILTASHSVTLTEGNGLFADSAIIIPSAGAGGSFLSATT